MIRKSPISGSWYEGTETKLNHQIEMLFEDTEYGYGEIPQYDSSNEQLLGVISPHAGLAYSGTIATHSYAAIASHYQEIDFAIVIGPNHRRIGPEISIPPSGTWRFPTGDLQIADSLIDYIKDFEFDTIANKISFENSAHAQEHSIDIQFPFLLYLFNTEFEILPICLGNQSLDPVGKELGKMLSSLKKKFSDKTIIVIASTDLSHEYDINKVEKNDEKIIESIENGKTKKIDKIRREYQVSMCGYGSVYTLLEYCNNYSTEFKVKTLKYSNSGRITNQMSGYTVGYYSAKAISL